MRNLALEIDNGSGYQWAWLSDDASVTVENVNPVFDTEAGGTFTHSISLDVARNSHIFGAAADFRGPKIFNLLRKKKARLWIMGYPVTGIIQLDTELSVEDGQVEIEIVSNSKELSDLLDGVNCQDVDISDDNIMLGYALPEYMDVKFKVHKILHTFSWDGDDQTYGTAYWAYYIGEEEGTASDETHQIALPKFVFTKWNAVTPYENYTIPDKNFYNVQYPYVPGREYNMNEPDSYPYCNVRSCYKKYINADGNWTEKRGYMHGEPDRINSAPCFYIGYWFRKLWQNLGITVESNSLEKISDFNRMAFFHFDPHFDWGEMMVFNYLDLNDEQQEKNKFHLSASLSTACDGKFYTTNENYGYTDYYTFNVTDVNPNDGTYLYHAIANSKNFPDTDAQNVLESMQGAFGARFIYNSSQASLTVALVRDVLRQNSTTDLPCVVTEANKTEPGTLGFRLKYEGSSEATYNGITKVDDITGANEQYDADTNYNYTDWTNVIFITESSLPSTIENQSRQVKIPNYIALVNHITNSDKTCYVSCTTGNAYRIKVDSDAEDESTLYPSLFQVGMFQDWTEGDCSHEASDDSLIEEVSIPFTPVIPNDINIDNEKQIYISNLDTALHQTYAQLLDGEIHNIDTENNGTLSTQTAEYKNLVLYSYYDSAKDSEGNTKGTRTAITGTMTLTIRALETYDISEDGPYYSYTNDSLIIGVMRGSGADAALEYYGDNYDNEDGEMWVETAGTDAEFSADSIDEYGKSFDYDGKAGDVITYTSETKTVSQGNAPLYIAEYFPDSNADLTTAGRKVSASDMSSKGYSISGTYATVYSMVTTIDDKDYLYTPIADNGTIYSSDEMSSYIEELKSSGNTIMTADSSSRKLFIGSYYADSNHLIANYHSNLLHNLHEVYYGGTSKSIEFRTYTVDTSLGYDYDDDYNFPLSLKLRAEKENPGYDTTCSKVGYTYSADGKSVTLKNGTVVPNQRFFPITGTNAAGRGLGDRFYKEYAYWVLNRKILEMDVEASAAVLTGIDMTKRYRIGGVEGFIKQYSYSVSMKDGISDAKIELYYI